MGHISLLLASNGDASNGDEALEGLVKVHPGLKLELVTIYCKQGGCKRPPNSAPHSSGPLR